MFIHLGKNAVTTRGFVTLHLLDSLTDLYVYHITKFFSGRNNGNVVETVPFDMRIVVQQLSEMLLPSE